MPDHRVDSPTAAGRARADSCRSDRRLTARPILTTERLTSSQLWVNKLPIFTGLAWVAGAGCAVRWLGHRLRTAWVGWVMAKVYVSSTIVDLRQERQAVLEWLRGARHQAVDSYLPDSDTVRDSCLEDVGTCDLYVLILGNRYGFQPPDENPEGLSITQLEFRRAGERGIPRIALVRTSIPDVSLSDLGDPPRLALVSAFRAEVAREVRAAEFSDLQGLVQGLSTGVLAAL